jgi:DNA polymerase III sliding clamp (beta) subunit (PCNA family)
MKIKKDELKQALEIVKPGLANKEIIEQTTSFAFTEGKVVTYNDEICISHPLPDVELQGVIKAEELYKFLSKVKNDEIIITTEENEIQMKAGRARAGFALMLEISLPLEEELKKESDWKPLPEKFLKALGFAIPCVAKDMSNPKLVCIHLNEKGVVEATDNFRLVRYELGEKLSFSSTLIPGVSMKEVLKIKPTHVSSGRGWLHFKNEQGTEISCRTLDEKYVNVSDALPKDEGAFDFVFPKETTEVLDKAEIFMKQMNEEGVNVSIAGTRLVVSSESETAWFKESIKIEEHKGKDFSFSITPYLLQGILKDTCTCKVYESMLKFSSEDWIYISTLRENVKQN